MKTHAEHETTVAIGRTQGFLLCLDCRTIIEDLPLCGARTKRGRSCRWAVTAGSETAEHPHGATDSQAPKEHPKKVKLETRPRAFISPAESRWLAHLIKTSGNVMDHAITLEGIKRGQAELIVGRYGGTAEGGRYDDWQWRCDGPQAERIIAAIQQV